MTGILYHQTVAATIVSQMARGASPLQKTWRPGQRFLPYNPLSGRAYRGMNAIWLLSVAEERGLSDARWMTYAQAAQAGGQVLKGEEGTVLQYWKWREEVPLRDKNGYPRLTSDGKPRVKVVEYERPRLFSFLVFNADQIHGLPKAPERPVLAEQERYELLGMIAARSRVNIVHTHGGRANYSHAHDRITIPEPGRFDDAEAYCAAMLRTLCHASGHPSRLGRDLRHPPGSRGFAREALRSAVGSLLLGNSFSIGYNQEYYISYLMPWSEIVENDPREIFRAAADAERIAAWMRGLEPRLQETLTPGERSVAETVVVRGSGSVAETGGLTYLAVPYAERREAYALGARWDGTARCWYAPRGVDTAALARWSLERARAAHTNPVDEFAAALSDMGLMLKGAPVADGRIHRVSVDGDRTGEKSGAYALHLDGRPGGYIQNFKTGEKRNWKSSQPVAALSEAERRQLLEESAARRAERDREAQEIHVQSVRLLGRHVEGSPAPSATHPYLAEKGVGAHGIFLDVAGPLALTGGRDDVQQWSRRGNLLIPVCDIHGELLTVQSIDDKKTRDEKGRETWRKSFPRGARWPGGMHQIGNFEGDTFIIVEGYATGASIHEMTGLPVAVAFHAGNLEAVATALRSAHPDARIIIAGDNDHHKPRETGPDGRPKPNVGREAAEKAAGAVGGFALLPRFAPDDQGTDWNDLVAADAAVVAEQWRDGMAAAERHFEAREIAARREDAKEVAQQERPEKAVHSR